ncbi:SDR family NAD(P)-dependent oxidoreductase [Kutzneria chonburiensis]|uniref:SDR family NAD(P)-dependent oxidoreductase n=1 Tax=Kutzneria chonburiensis TaxID=1483604 RepID=A0ABV6MYN5_9PSEU|nr:SDR family NAD(P)-dependent oxidoreductase [Kutzneria chonburiensis]
MRELTGKVAVVTGGVRGLGRQIATALRAAGAEVAITGRDVDAVAVAAEEIGDGVLPVVCDIRHERSVDGLVPAVLERFGRIDVLVNNSGIAGPTVPLWECSPGAWREVIDTNVLGTFLCCRAVLPTMIRQRSGSVIVIGSATGKRPLAGRTSYAASKTALIGLTRSLATEAGPHGIRVNLVSPGAIDGDRFRGVVDAMAASRGVPPEILHREATAGSPLGRLVQPEQVTDVVTFLAGDGAGGITGDDINVSAGLVMY